jgi:hypothetical protein
VSGLVFISYDYVDEVYVRRLTRHLRAGGVEVWSGNHDNYDERAHAAQSCAAFVPVMTPESERSDWVQNEITRAQESHRAILPLLLAGRPFPRLDTVPHTDVRGRRMPDATYVAHLRELAPGELAPTSPAEEPQPHVAQPHVARPRELVDIANVEAAVWTVGLGVVGLVILTAVFLISDGFRVDGRSMAWTLLTTVAAVAVTAAIQVDNRSRRALLPTISVAAIWFNLLAWGIAGSTTDSRLNLTAALIGLVIAVVTIGLGFRLRQFGLVPVWMAVGIAGLALLAAAVGAGPGDVAFVLLLAALPVHARQAGSTPAKIGYAAAAVLSAAAVVVAPGYGFGMFFALAVIIATAASLRPAAKATSPAT